MRLFLKNIILRQPIMTFQAILKRKLAKKLARDTLPKTRCLDSDAEEEDEEEERKKEDPKDKRKRKSPPPPKAPRKKRSSKK
ncbi:hypothetical protein R1flu_001886 [Riccia fluitans]|uniref:Uncharacterized protein n=1 Tax=Riccia fluitans TaxID=41844 RepID=A0ABD1Y4J2_9MARC